MNTNTNTNTNTSKNHNALETKIKGVDDDDCLFSKPIRPFEPEIYVPFPSDTLTFNENQIDIRNPNFVTQLDYIRYKSIRAASSRNFSGNA